MSDFENTGGAAVLIIAGIAGLYKGSKCYRQYRLIRDIPRSTVRSLAMGIAEVHGQIKAIDYLTSPFSRTKCVWYKYVIEEYRPRKKGPDWTTIATDSKWVSFIAQDETGEVLVDPTDAHFYTDLRHKFKDDVGIIDGVGRMFQGLGNIGKSTTEKLATIPTNNLKLLDSKGVTWWTRGDRRFSEYYLKPDDTLYILGTVTNADQNDRLVIKKGSNNPTFVIGDKTETSMLSSLKKKTFTMMGFGFFGVVGGLALLLWQLGML